MKKVYISLILIIIIILGMSSTSLGAQFHDTIGTKYESPTEILYTLGIADGTSEHVFSTNRAVTRAEMAKLILRVYGLDDASVKMSLGTHNFKDVKASEWYYGYVNVAADMKMINGYSDGTFRPNDKVTYSEAITMIIRALGYTDLETKPGEKWDAPYIRKMTEIRLAKNVGYFKYDDDATRGNIAIMIWNMLNADSYMVIKDKTYVGFIKETTPQKVIWRYYPDYAIIDDDILEDILVYKDVDEDDNEVVEYYISTKEIFAVKVKEPIPLKRIGAKVSGIYSIKDDEAIGLNFIYDEKFDEGTTKELEEIYKLKSKNEPYVLGKSKNYAYIYFNEDEKIDRITYLGSNENILVKEAKIQKEKHKEIDEEGKEHEVDGLEYIIINANEDEKIYTELSLINADGQLLSWSSVKENGVLSKIRNGMYVYNTKTIKGELEDVFTKKSQIFLKVDGELLACDGSVTYKLYGSETTKVATEKLLKEHIGKNVELITSYSKEVMQINLERNYENASESTRFGVVTEVNTYENEPDTTELEVATGNGTKTYTVDKTIWDKKIEPGALIHFEQTASEIEFMDVFTDNAKVPGGTVDMNLDGKVYENNFLDKYEIDENTVIYIIQKEYDVNSDSIIKDYHMVIEKDVDVLEHLDDLPVHVLYDEFNIAVAVFIEKEVNKYDYKYARVLEVYQEKEEKNDEVKYTLKIKVSPFNNIIAKYKIEGYINCEPGDLISYTVKEDTIRIKERYNANLLGDKRDYIVENVEKNIVHLTNGDTIDIKKNAFEIEGETYLFDRYVVVFSKVSKLTGEWEFISNNIVEPNKLELKAGDRIAIDEIEDTIIIYRGYTE